MDWIWESNHTLKELRLYIILGFYWYSQVREMKIRHNMSSSFDMKRTEKRGKLKMKWALTKEPVSDDEIDDEAVIGQGSEPRQRFRSIKIAGRHALFSLWTVMCPPLFLDWEEILRNHTDRPDVFDKEPWERLLPKDLGPSFQKSCDFKPQIFSSKNGNIVTRWLNIAVIWFGWIWYESFHWCFTHHEQNQNWADGWLAKIKLIPTHIGTYLPDG